MKAEKERSDLEIAKLLAKTMQSSYKKNEIHETINRIMDKMSNLLNSDKNKDELIKLKLEFQQLKNDVSGLLMN